MICGAIKNEDSLTNPSQVNYHQDSWDHKDSTTEKFLLQIHNNYMNCGGVN